MKGKILGIAVALGLLIALFFIGCGDDDDDDDHNIEDIIGLPPSSTGFDGWWPQDHPSTRAIWQVERANDPDNKNNPVLKASCNYDPNKRGEGLANGEIFREQDLGNLQGATLKCKIRVTKGARGRGNAPNGLQFLLKSEGGKSYYSKWENIRQEDQWFELTAKPLEGEGVDAGFDITHVIMGGVKMGLNDDATERFDGCIFIDDFQIIGADIKIIAEWDFKPK